MCLDTVVLFFGESYIKSNHQHSRIHFRILLLIKLEVNNFNL